MNCRENNDLFFLTDEKFDFDVSLSPASSKGDEDEDEVFMGPITHKEKCISVSVTSQLEESGVRGSWSPLTGDQLAAVCNEATKLADQLQGSDRSLMHSEENKTTDVTTESTESTSDKEQFIQDTEAKLGVLGSCASVVSPIKRQTFVVQDSPMKQLPPAFQRRLLRGNSSTTVSSSSSRPNSTSSSSSSRLTTTATTASSSRRSITATSNRSAAAASTRLSTSSPVVVGVKAQPRTGLRGKAAQGIGVVLPSKPVAMTTSAIKTKAEKTRLQPPGKSVGALKRSPMSRPSSRANSCEDLLSDSASVASDISDSSLNSSMLGKKRTMVPPSKVARNLLGVKTSSPSQSRRLTDRKNTSSSSSSVSSFNSSISLSPAKGKINSSLNRSVSSSTGPTPSSISRPRRSTVYNSVEPNPATSSSSKTATTRRSLSIQARKPSEVERAKAARSTPLKRAVVTPLQVTPAKRVTACVAPTSAIVRPLSTMKTKPRPEALVLPTPSTGTRGVTQGDDVSKMMRPKRLMSVDSLPQKPSAAPLTPSAGSCRSLQVKPRCPSALPTPVKRRMSALPLLVATPTNQTRLIRPPSNTDSDSAPCPSSTRRDRSRSPAPAYKQEVEPVDAPDIKPFCLEVEEEEEEVVKEGKEELEEVNEEKEEEKQEEEQEQRPPVSLPSHPPQLDQSEKSDPAEAPSQGESEASKNLIELETTEETSTKLHEALLLDLPAPSLQPQEKLLIDLTNTPVLIRTSSKTCSANQQLIDLSSPLIKWSPEDKMENKAPLINLSF